jgi:hypothetical protein
MLQSEQVEELMNLVSAMDKPTLIHQFRDFPARFPVDFTSDFLDDCSLDRLQHLFVALCLQNQRLPQMIDPARAA